jgi:hypothetical protein
MAQYFVRFSDSKEWLEADAARGYSFHSYQFANSAEELLEEWYPDRLENEGVEDLVDEMDIREHSNGQFGFALNGLCGYGPFETLEDAEEESKNGSYGIYTTCGIFEGCEAGLDPDNNQLFRPTKLVKVIESVAA